MNNSPIHLFGDIYWLPPHTPGRGIFPPNKVFRGEAIFTSDFNISFSVQVNYSETRDSNQCQAVRLFFPFLDWDQAQELSHNSEILLMEGFTVIAVCRNLSFNMSKKGSLEDKWIKV